MLSLLTADAAQGGGMIMIVYVVLIIGFFYFFLMRPQKKEQKRVAGMLASLEIGDVVCTTSGFYGVVIDITDDTVIVEFGNNEKRSDIGCGKSGELKTEIRRVCVLFFCRELLAARGSLTASQIFDIFKEKEAEEKR